jgi:hypothetical protein
MIKGLCLAGEVWMRTGVEAIICKRHFSTGILAARSSKSDFEVILTELTAKKVF